MKNTYLIILIVIIMGLAAMMVVGPFNSTSPADDPFEQKACFVSDSNKRVFRVYADTLDNKMMRRHGNRLMYSPGQYTAVYFYEERSAASVDLSVVSGFE